MVNKTDTNKQQSFFKLFSCVQIYAQILLPLFPPPPLLLCDKHDSWGDSVYIAIGSLQLKDESPPVCVWGGAVVGATLPLPPSSAAHSQTQLRHEWTSGRLEPETGRNPKRGEKFIDMVFE